MILLILFAEEEEDKGILGVWISYLCLFSNFLFLHIYNMGLVIVYSVLYLLRCIYAHVGGGVGTCTRACSCACTTCTTGS